MTEGLPRGDGDGWVDCTCGRRHWGRFGAAGLLLNREGRVLLQHRVAWSHDGDTWGIPGGARNSGESALGASLREAVEETALDPAAVRPTAEYTVDHGTWSYTTVLADAVRRVDVTPLAESADLSWVEPDRIEQHVLHPAFAAAWPVLRPAVGLVLTIVVDAANVFGSRPDGWWRDRAGAALRLLDSIAQGLPRPLPASAIPPGLQLPDLSSWHPAVVTVVEGAAKSVPSGTHHSEWLQVVRAPGAGDDEIAARAASAAASGSAVLVVTADRGLGVRVAASGAATTGPHWLLRLLDSGR